MNSQFKRIFLIFSSLLVLVLLSSCGTSNTSSYSSSGSASAAQPTPAATTAPSTPDTSKDYGNGNTSTTNTAGDVIKTSSATVGGKSLTILTNAQGLTLYYFTPDTASKTACTAGCASTWPPLLSSTGKPTASGLSGSLEVYPNANGKQITYNDHPLYTFSGDSAPGQTNGQGIGGKWFVVTPSVAKNQP